MRLALGAVLALIVTGQSAAQSIEVVVPAQMTIEALPSGATTKPVNLTRVAGNIPAGTPWIQQDVATAILIACSGGGKITRWSEENNKVSNLEVFDRIFREELKKVGFQNGGDPSNLFEDQKSSDIQIGALINGLRVRTCEKTNLRVWNTGGSGVMEVEWQLYSVSEAKILARINTYGGVTVPTQKGFELDLIVGGAFAENVRRLTANDTFRRLLTSKSPQPAENSLSQPHLVRLPSGERTPSLHEAVKSVVTIFAGDGMGSGVLVSDDGYILTNHHVVGSRGQVRIRWQDGTSTIGEVARSDARRDVAVVKTEPKSTALSVRTTAVQLGEAVFAVGTPLDRSLANSLTRGIVSAQRLIEGQPYIQSDVAVTHGNSGGPLLNEAGQVVGITVSGLEPNGAPIGLNFFIPIADALKALGIQPQGQ